MEVGEYFSSESEGTCPPFHDAPQEGPIYAHYRDQNRDEHERHPAFKREPERARNAIKPSSTNCPDLPAFVGIWKKSFEASARGTSMGDESTCTSENCKTLRMTRSSMWEGESFDQQGSFFQGARSEQLSAMSPFERVFCR